MHAIVSQFLYYEIALKYGILRVHKGDVSERSNVPLC